MGNQGRNTAETTGGNHVSILGKISEENPWKNPEEIHKAARETIPRRMHPVKEFQKEFMEESLKVSLKKKSGEIPLNISKRIS